MARVLFKDLLGTAPEFHVAVPDLGEMLAHHDAALLLGDPALKADLSGLHVLDLAAGWRRLTGLPFVFAVWAVRPSIAAGAVPVVARLREDAHRREIVAVAAQRTGLAQSALHEYLDGDLHHDLESEDDEKGLSEFYRRAHAHGLLPSPDAPPFVGVPLVPRREL